MKHLFTIILFILSVTAYVQAQITLTSADAASLYSTVRYNYSDTSTTSANIGAPGGSNNWDFSALKLHKSTVFENVTPSSTPYITDFPTANLVTKSQTPTSGGQYTDYFTYANLSETSYSVLGGEMGMTYMGMTVLTKMVNNPGERVVIFPATYGTNWTEHFAYTLSSVMGGIIMNSSTENHTTYYTIDAYGTLTVPGGGTAEALRVKKDTRYILTKDNSYHRRISYEFMTRNGFSVGLHVPDTLAANNGIIAVDNMSWSSNTAVGVEETDRLPETFTLSQNYPNPFNPSTAIEFELPESAHATLKVYDTLGKEIAVLFSGNASAGRHKVYLDGSRLNSGLYFCRLQTEGFQKTIKMTLLK